MINSLARIRAIRFVIHVHHNSWTNIAKSICYEIIAIHVILVHVKLVTWNTVQSNWRRFKSTVTTGRILADLWIYSGVHVRSKRLLVHLPPDRSFLSVRTGLPYLYRSVFPFSPDTSSQFVPIGLPQLSGQVFPIWTDRSALSVRIGLLFA